MNDKVVSIRSKPRAIGLHIYMGHHSHRLLENLLANGQLPVSRAVMDASHADEQRELSISLKKASVQLVLDTRSVELGTPGGITSVRRRLPWARAEGHWTAEDLSSRSVLKNYCHQIVGFAIDHGVDVVLAPTHLVAGVGDPWFAVDRTACEQLRMALDAGGGSSIAIDYPLVTEFSLLGAPGNREQFLQQLSGLPFDNLWIRAAGFGLNATVTRTKNFIQAASGLAAVGRPVIADSVGGFVGLAAAAFGVVSDLAHGISNSNEQFDSYRLRKPSKNSGGGAAKWVYLSTIDKYVKAKDVDALLGIRGVKPSLICNDPNCCPNGASSMKSSEKRHALKQRARQLHALAAIPEHRRPDELLRQEIVPAGRICRTLVRQAGVLEQPTVLKMFDTQSRRLDDFEKMMEGLMAKRGELQQAREPTLHYSNLMPKASGY